LNIFCLERQGGIGTSPVINKRKTLDNNPTITGEQLITK